MAAVGLLNSLPAPSREYAPVPEQQPSRPAGTGKVVTEPPPYGSAERRHYRPRRPSDFGDGGAFPEVHMPQFPRGMGLKNKATSREGQTLALTIGPGGGVNYDALVKQGKNRDKWVASDHSALVPKLDKLKEEMAKPDEEEIEKTKEDTAAALGLVVNNKIQASQPKTLPQQPGAATYIKYTPSQQGPQYNSGAGQRIIKMQDMAVDPMEPPKFRHKKVPRGTGDLPVPVMHSPPRNVSVKDMQEWKIPPCISNWKNAKGYTIPLDKRLAADGRGLQEVQINDQFAKLTEALYVAESKAREAVDMRQKVIREQKLREKDQKEAELRELAMRARMERGGNAGAAASTVPLAARGEGYLPPPPPMGGTGGVPGGGYDEDNLPPPPPMQASPPRERETREEREERRQREEIRRDRQRERERERRLEARDAHGGKRSKLTRDRDRDISEKVALGQAKVTGTGEAMYDQRLFNQEGGMGHGLIAEDTYNLYDKALFAERGSNLHRARAPADEDGDAGEEAGTRRFKPDKGFAGVDYGAAAQDDSSAPVQFERDAPEADPFGLDSFLTDVKSGRKKGGALDGIGKGGSMAAGGGGGSYDDYAGGSSRRMEFQSGRG